MGIRSQIQWLCHANIQRLLLIFGMIIAFIVLSQLFTLPYRKYSILSYSNVNSGFTMVGGATLLNRSMPANAYIVHGLGNYTDVSDLDEDAGYANGGGEDKNYDFALNDDGEIDKPLKTVKNSYKEFTSEKDLTLKKDLSIRNVRSTRSDRNREKASEYQLIPIEQEGKSNYSSTQENYPKTNTATPGKYHNRAGFEFPPLMAPMISSNDTKDLNKESRASSLSVPANRSSVQNSKQAKETHLQNNSSTMAGNSRMKERAIRRSTTISEMNTLLIQTPVSTKSARSHWSSARDRELQNAKLQIENAPILRNTLGLHASLFRNISMFRRSYELMEKMLKVYIYREGEKPIFHQPHLRGIYASEGWFMKLMEGNKHFVVRDPKKAHLFYLPFSSNRLRSLFYTQNFATHKDLEKYLTSYMDMIAKKYSFWNRTGGADHFLVACHDWGPSLTRKNMGNGIRVFCNSNVARGFKIGKDVSLPVTYVRTSQNPQIDLGGNPPSERPILAFFAGSVHGYLRPILLQYWNNKEQDMKILGPMPRDIEGKSRYRNFMKSSKYCICAKGYEVHTPRVVESIYYECVPVIISDNYVPPFFQVLDWEAFCVFILEKDIPNLRNILVSIPEEKYLAMQHRVKMVQQHFLWHKSPVKYDIFHMILHSVWYNRVFQVRNR